MATKDSLTREDVMEFLRSDQTSAVLTNDDRIEIFLRILPGADDITLDLFEELCSDYNVDFDRVLQNKGP